MFSIHYEYDRGLDFSGHRGSRVKLRRNRTLSRDEDIVIDDGVEIT